LLNSIFLYIYTELIKKFTSYERTNSLQPVLIEFTEAAKGNVNRKFWQKIFKHHFNLNKLIIAQQQINAKWYFKGNVSWNQGSVEFAAGFMGFHQDKKALL